MTKNYNKSTNYSPDLGVTELIPINKPQLDDDERLEVTRVLEEGNLTSAAFEGGRRVTEFEQLLENYLKVKHAVAVNSGTSAIHAALIASDVQSGDEIILPSLTFVATANAVVAAGAEPIFVDVMTNGYTIDPAKIKEKITNKTKAIIPVHLYGHPAAMQEIIEVADKQSLVVIEDACQSLGSTYLGKQTGSLGKMGCFSLYASKVVTSGEGGAVTTNDDDLANQLRMVRNHGMIKGYDTKVLGLNMRLPEINAAIAKVQMKKLDRFLNIRRRNALIIQQILTERSRDSEVTLPIEPNGLVYNWYLYTVTLGRNRDKIKNILNSRGIGATVYYDPPVHLTPYYSMKYPQIKLESTEKISKKVLSLPVHQSMSEEQAEYVATNLVSTLEN
ncbi:MAG TPA: DegT/DnrJ/EryC1/StrS family aminotransferase [Nitrososphaeraceae archaeon]